MRSVRPLRRVAFVHPNLSYGGAERVLLEQVRALAPRDVDVDLFVTERVEDPDFEADLRRANPRLRRIDAETTSKGLARAVRRARPDVVALSLTARGLRALERIPRWWGRPPALVTVHSRYGAALDPLRVHGRSIDALALTHGFHAEAEAALGVPRSRHAVTRPLFPDLLLPTSPDTEEAARALRASLGIPPTAFVIGYFGRIGPGKGAPTLVRAAGRLASAGLDVHLLLLGRLARPDDWEAGPFLAALDGAIAATGPALSGRLHRPGPRARAAAVYRAFDVTALPSDHEGLLPLMLVESMSVGVPVVATAVGGITECLRDGVDAEVVPKAPDDGSPLTASVEDAFTARLEALARDPARARRLGEAGRASVRALVAANDFAGDFLAALDLARRRGRP